VTNEVVPMLEQLRKQRLEAGSNRCCYSIDEMTDSKATKQQNGWS
jgi:hypothetical protein